MSSVSSSGSLSSISSPTSSSSSPTTSSTTSTTSTTTTSSSSSTSSTTSSSSSTSSTSSSSSTTSSSSSTTPTSSSTTETPSSSSSFSQVFSTSTNSQSTVVVTSTIPVTPSASGSTAADSTSGDKGFFHNTGAVAGVFTVLGLIVIAIVVVIVTTVIRRRRARRYDREIAEAAIAGPAPIYLDDNDNDNMGGTYGTRGGYSDVSSMGTYAQHPMSAESFNMQEIGAGAAGVGVQRQRSMGQAWHGVGETENPYPAFAMPQGAYNHQQAYQGYEHQQYDYPQQSQAYQPQHQQSYDTYDHQGQAQPVYDGYSDGGHGAVLAYSDGHGGQHSPPPADLSRTPSKSLLNNTPPMASPESPQPESYAAYYASPVSAHGASSSAGGLPNPYDEESEEEDIGDSQPKVLKVANE